MNVRELIGKEICFLDDIRFFKSIFLPEMKAIVANVIPHDEGANGLNFSLKLDFSKHFEHNRRIGADSYIKFWHEGALGYVQNYKIYLEITQPDLPGSPNPLFNVIAN